MSRKELVQYITSQYEIKVPIHTIRLALQQNGLSEKEIDTLIHQAYRQLRKTNSPTEKFARTEHHLPNDQTPDTTPQEENFMKWDRLQRISVVSTVLGALLFIGILFALAQFFFFQIY